MNKKKTQIKYKGISGVIHRAVTLQTARLRNFVHSHTDSSPAVTEKIEPRKLVTLLKRHVNISRMNLAPSYFPWYFLGAAWRSLRNIISAKHAMLKKQTKTKETVVKTLYMLWTSRLRNAQALCFFSKLESLVHILRQLSCSESPEVAALNALHAVLF